MGSLIDVLSDEFISIGDAFVMDGFCTIVLVHLHFIESLSTCNH
jgi:hypothetical protein